MPGRPASTIRSDCCSPPILPSRSRRPVADARQLAVALIGVGGHVEGDRQRLREALEAAVIAAGLGKIVELALGVLDLGARGQVHRRVEGDVDHVLADADQVAAQRQLIDRAAVVLRVDDGGGFGGEPGEVLADTVMPPMSVSAGRKVFSVTGWRSCPRGSGCRRCRRSVWWIGSKKCFGLEKVRNPVERVVVDQDRAQQRPVPPRYCAERSGTPARNRLQVSRLSNRQGP